MFRPWMCHKFLRHPTAVLWLVPHALFLAVLFFSINSFAHQNTQPEPDAPRVDRGPITSYDRAATVDSTTRRNRNSRHDHSEQDLITEDSAPIFLIISPSHPEREPLPTGKSDVIVVGTINSAQSYLSNDKKNIYSEFGCVINEVIKPSNGPRISPGDSITVERQGGRIRLPSGKLVTRGTLDEPMPAPGGQYVLFLRRLPGDDDFVIVTAYRLQANHVYWLDDRQHDSKHPKLVPELREKDVSQFLADLRQRASQGGPK